MRPTCSSSSPTSSVRECQAICGSSTRGEEKRLQPYDFASTLTSLVNARDKRALEDAKDDLSASLAQNVR